MEDATNTDAPGDAKGTTYNPAGYLGFLFASCCNNVFVFVYIRKTHGTARAADEQASTLLKGTPLEEKCRCQMPKERFVAWCQFSERFTLIIQCSTSQHSAGAAMCTCLNENKLCSQVWRKSSSRQNLGRTHQD